MKQNLYIPGDLVMYDGKICKVEEIKNNYLFKTKNYTLQFPNSNSYSVEEKDITSIPITPEILEKNGWKKENVGYSPKNQGPIFLYKDNGGGWAVEIGDEFISVISFVHQLQQLLFILGLDSNMIVQQPSGLNSSDKLTK